MQAVEAIQQLKQQVDTLIIIPNDKLLDAVDANMPVRGGRGGGVWGRERE